MWSKNGHHIFPTRSPRLARSRSPPSSGLPSGRCRTRAQSSTKPAHSVTHATHFVAQWGVASPSDVPKPQFQQVQWQARRPRALLAHASAARGPTRQPDTQAGPSTAGSPNPPTILGWRTTHSEFAPVSSTRRWCTVTARAACEGTRLSAAADDTRSRAWRGQFLQGV